eukprot:gene2807-722_t
MASAPPAKQRRLMVVEPYSSYNSGVSLNLREGKLREIGKALAVPTLAAAAAAPGSAAAQRPHAAGGGSQLIPDRDVNVGMRGPVHVIDSSSDAPALEHYIFKKTNSKGPYLRMCKTALEAIRGSAAASSGWGFNLDDWIAVLRAPKEKKLQSQSLDRLIRIATVSYTPAPGDVQPGTTVGGAAAGGGARGGTEPAPSEDVLAIGVAGMNQYTLVDNPVRLRLALEALEGAVSVAVDLEGVNLGGSQEDGGYITTIQLCKEARGLVYIIDLLSLGDEAAFTGPYSMRDFLQDPAVEKLFWDCRTDLRALRSNHGVEVRNIVDLQLVQVACLSASGADVVRVQGLGRAIDKSLKHQLTHEERTRIEDTKELSHRLFAPNLGGSFDILAVRPLLPVLIEYCTDVRYFHMLKITFAVPRGMFTCGVEVEFPHELSAAIAKRVESSASMMYRPDDRDANTLADPELVAAVAKKRDEAKTAGLGGPSDRGDRTSAVTKGALRTCKLQVSATLAMQYPYTSVN